MDDLIEIRLKNRIHFSILRYTYVHLRSQLPLNRPEDLSEALAQLLENIVEHAYVHPENMDVTVRFRISSRQLQIDVEDNGLPFDFTPFMSEAIDQSTRHDKGFFRVYDLVDRFWFTMLENRGKRFSVVQSFSHPYDIKTGKVSTVLPDKATVLQRLKVRLFEPADAEGIAKLIYKNYHYTYYKSQFYDPVKIRTLNAEGEVYSIVAVYGITIVGHFAMVLSKHSNIAEIGIATVDPEFKKMGIMNRMFDRLIEQAEVLKLNAVYAEAIMLHPYSQKANRRHGMSETAIILGEVPSQIEIEHSLKAQMRSGAVMDFLIFDKQARYIAKVARYDDMIDRLYSRLSIRRLKQPPGNPGRLPLSHFMNSRINIGYIVIEALFEPSELDTVLDLMHTDHCDMVYADINLHHTAEIDTVVEMLNRHRFFYSGVLISFYHNEDYLRLQRKNTRFVDEEQLVCYSQDIKALLEYIQKDEAEVSPKTTEPFVN